MSRKCPKCNYALPDNATFCGVCGMKFAAPGGMPPQGQRQAPPQRQMPPQQRQMPPQGAVPSQRQRQMPPQGVNPYQGNPYAGQISSGYPGGPVMTGAAGYQRGPGMSITAMVCGICSLLFMLISFAFMDSSAVLLVMLIISSLASIAGIILASIVFTKGGAGKGMAIAGMVTSCVDILPAFIMLIFAIKAVSVIGSW